MSYTDSGKSLRAAALSGAMILLAALAPATGAQAGQLDFDIVFGEHAGGRIPSQATWSPRGDLLTYVWQEGEANALWSFDPRTKRTRRLLTVGEEGEPPRLDKLSAYRWSPTGDSLLLLSDGDLYHLALAGSELERLTVTAETEKDPKFSPDGGRVAFVRGYDLFLLDLENGEERRLTDDGSENEILNGTTDWVYWEEIWGRDSTGFWWSPAGDRIAYYRFDDRAVESYPLVDSTNPYSKVEWQRYPTAGEANPIVKVGVLDLLGGETTWLDTGDDDDVYLARVDWRSSGDRVAVQRLNRDQDRLDLLLCDPGSGKCSTLLRETAATWVNLTRDLRFLADDRFLWTSEASGWRRLLLYTAEGKSPENLTPEGWTVGGVAALHAEDGQVTVTAHPKDGLGALRRAVLRLPLTGGEPDVLAAGDSWQSVLAASDDAQGGWVAIASGNANHPARARVVGAGGATVAELPSEPPTAFEPRDLPQWEFFTLPGPGGSRLPAGLLKPAGFDPARKYPAIMYHYGGPASQVVSDRWSARGRGLWHKMMAERGYAILSVDNQASNYFGKTGADLVHRRFGEINLAAQRAGVDYLASLGWVDSERVGIWGWSGGGSNTLYVLLSSPGTWAAGVSGAPVTDWRFYDSIWTERYLDHPADNPDGYRDSSAITRAAALTDKLLIVHGTADDNVHPNNTLAMIRKMIDAGVAFEDAIYPRQKHGFRGGDSRHFYQRMTEFFDRHLGGGKE